MRIYKLLILFFVSGALLSLRAQSTLKTGTTASQSLKIGVGARAVGMGGAFTASSGDITSLYWNPAGIAGINSNEAVFNHINWVADIGYDYVAAATPVAGLGTLGAFVSVLSTDDMPVRTIERPEGTGENFNYGSFVAGLSYARPLTDNFSVGFNFKYVNEKIWNMSANGFAIDAGVLYRIPILNEFRIAASISNFGTKMKLEGRDILEIKQVGTNLINTKVDLDEFDLPLMFRFGVSADAIKSQTHRLTLEADAIHPNDHTEYLNAGSEYSWNETFFIRAGYKSLFEKDTEQGLTLGAGINYRLIEALKIKIDYAYEDFGRLKNVHYFSVGINF